MGAEVKILGVVGMIFIYLKVTSKKSVPEPSVYNYYFSSILKQIKVSKIIFVGR